MLPSLRRGTAARVCSLGAGWWLAVAALASATEPLGWETGWKQASRGAAEQMRPILLDFTADWCVPCRAMDAEFWGLSEVRAVAERFVRVRVDYDRELGLRRRFGVGSIPTVLVLDPWGNPIGRLIGWGGSPRDHLRLLRAVPADFAPMAADAHAAATGKADGLAWERLGDAYFPGALAGASRDFLERAEKSRELKREPARRATAWTKLGWCELKLGDAERALEWLEKAVASAAPPDHPDVALAGLAVAWARLGEPERARPALERLRAEHPGSELLPIALGEVERAAGGAARP